MDEWQEAAQYLQRENLDLRSQLKDAEEVIDTILRDDSISIVMKTRAAEKALAYRNTYGKGE